MLYNTKVILNWLMITVPTFFWVKIITCTHQFWHAHWLLVHTVPNRLICTRVYMYGIQAAINRGTGHVGNWQSVVSGCTTGSPSYWHIGMLIVSFLCHQWLNMEHREIIWGYARVECIPTSSLLNATSKHTDTKTSVHYWLIHYFFRIVDWLLSLYKGQKIQCL